MFRPFTYLKCYNFNQRYGDDALYFTIFMFNIPKNYIIIWLYIKKVKVKSVPLQAWSGPEGSRKLRFPDFMTTAHGGGKGVSLTHRPHLPPGNSPGTHFCWGNAVAQWLRCCATNRKVAGSIPDGIIGIFH